MSSEVRHHVPHPLGLRVQPGEPRGYHIDLRAKLDSPDWEPPADPARTMWIDHVTQPGLAMFEHHVYGRGPEWLAGAVRLAEHLVRTQSREPGLEGAWTYGYPFPHTFHLEPPWVMAMAQGQATSLLVRAAAATGQDRFAEAARRGIDALARDVGTPGGVRSRLPTGGVLYEEYPTDPPAHVLNGAIYTLFGIWDLWQLTGDAAVGEMYAEAAEGIAGGLGLWDLGHWSRYDLYPHPPGVNVASPFYHRLHIDQLAALERISDDERFGARRRRFEGYAANPVNQARAVARKVVFRLRSPRSSLLGEIRAGIAERLPGRRA